MCEFGRLTRCIVGSVVIVISLTWAQSGERKKWTTLDWLQQLNYSHELHNVTSSDGYQLQLQRMPRVGARPVLLVHGLLGSSLGWLCLGPGKSLAFQLHQRNYDVWLANLRGASPYGRHHLELTDVMPEFWRYSFHEHGAYDLPAIIDHIVEHTKREAEQSETQAQQVHQVLLIGHSQKREKANKFELFPPGELRKLCSKKRELCEYYTKNLAGSALSNKQLLDIFSYEHLLQGGSARELRHLQQIWKSGDFISYDYGPIENMQIYHSVEALNYNISQISVPIILYFGETDAIATPEGVHGIYARMLNSVRSVRRIASAKFNHFDFLVAGEVKTLVNDKLIELMEKFLEGKLPYIIE
ncbi:lipase 1 isoform X2 [Drosophila novamexicana]|uniref:lipase 1 isoform X2 n=1 Tax=Drosophila novamexicana TaxID=47314 RepID=UPI0011E5D31B|nr:lipase 1 isoform X2 [Drosophila novamexicana]